MAARAYEALIEDILSGLLPQDVLISEQRLADRLGMSRTPIRRALARLEADGLVRVHPQRGVVIEPLSARQLTEIFQFREALEVLAAREAGVFDEHRLSKLDAVFAEFIAMDSDGDPTRMSSLVSEADEQLHRLIVAATMNRLMVAEFDRLRLKLVQIRAVSWGSRELVTNRGVTLAAAEHREIIAALRDGDREVAARALTAHLRAGRDHMLRTVASPHVEGRETVIRRSSLIAGWLHEERITPADIPGLVREAVRADAPADVEAAAP